MGAAGGVLVDLAEAVGAKTGRLLGGGGLFLLLGDGGELVDALYQQEDADGGAQEGENGLQEGAVGNLGLTDDELHTFEVHLAGDEGEQGHEDGIDQSGHDGGERAADDHTDGQVNDVALESEGLEFIPELFHGYTSFFLFECRNYIINGGIFK